MNAQPDDWDEESDVVVLGSGGAALIAAISAHHHGAGEVVILEKSGMVGGTTAMSGGMLWIPLDHHQQEHGVEDSFDEVVAYLDALAPEMLDPDAVSGFLEGRPAAWRTTTASSAPSSWRSDAGATSAARARPSARC